MSAAQHASIASYGYCWEVSVVAAVVFGSVVGETGGVESDFSAHRFKDA